MEKEARFHCCLQTPLSRGAQAFRVALATLMMVFAIRLPARIWSDTSTTKAIRYTAGFNRSVPMASVWTKTARCTPCRIATHTADLL